MFGQRSRSIAFYAAMTAMLLVLVTRLQLDVLPESVGVQVGHNSEAFLFAILACAEIQLLRGRLRTASLLLGMAAVGCLLVALGLWLRSADLGPTLTTLNEPIVGAGFLLLYLCLPRSRVVAIVCAVVVTVAIVVLFHTSFVLDQAESLVPLALSGPAIDIFFPGLLADEPVTGRRLQVAWMLGLFVLAVVLMPLSDWARASLTGSLEDVIDYLQRAAEGYWGWIFVYAYFAFWIDATRRSRAEQTDAVTHGPAHRVDRGALLSGR
jgi:hypothetical protein